jgi:hypothetical protein
MDGSMQPDISFVADRWPRAGHDVFNIVERLAGKAAP